MFHHFLVLAMQRLLFLFFAVMLASASAQQITVRLLKPAGGEVFRAGRSEDLQWDTTGYPGVYPTWRFQFSTSPTGPWSDLPGATAVKDSASRRGRFTGGFRVPAVATTNGYVRMVLVKPDGTLDETVTSRNQQPFSIEQPQAVRPDSILRTPITSRIQLSSKKIYGLDGYVFVDDGGVLVIEPGTIIVGDTVGQNSALCVNRGGKIIADGTRQRPIIMTSSAPPGQRASGDWGGLLICGRARTNHPGGQAALEGGIADANQVRGWFGGTDDDAVWCGMCGLNLPALLLFRIANSTHSRWAVLGVAPLLSMSSAATATTTRSNGSVARSTGGT